MGERDTRIERYLATACAAAAALLGVLGLAGFALGLPAPTRIGPGYQPIAPTVACALILFGLILAWAISGRGGRTRLAAAVVAGLASLYGLSEVVGFVVGADLNGEDTLIRYLAKAWSLPLTPMSPAAGALILLVGASLLALLLAPVAARACWVERLKEAAGGLGAAAAAGALVFALGYLYGAPLLYGSDVIPIAATASLGFLLLALGAVAAAGADQWPLRLFAGPSVRAQLLRVFVPLTVLAVLLSSLLRERMPISTQLNRALESSLLATVFALLAGVVGYRLAAALSGAIEQAQAALRESEQRFRTLAESMPQLVWLANAEGEVTYLNRQWTEYTGQEAPENRGQVIHPEDRPQAREAWQEAVRGERVFEDEYRLRRRGGAYRWFLARAVPTHDSEGRTLGWIGSATDIDDRKRAEEVLQRYQFLSQEARDIILFVALDGRILEANEAAARAYGYSREELLSLHIRELRARELRGAVPVQIAAAEREGVMFETWHQRKDGATFPVEVSSRAASIGGERVLLSIIRDITERKRVEAERERLLEEIERQRLLLDTLVENTEAQLAYLDRDFNFLRVNATYARTCRRAPEAFIGHNHFEFFPHPENEAIFRRVRDTGEAVEFREKPFEHPGQPERGTTYWDWTLTPVKSSEGEVEALVLSLVDVTEQVRARQQIAEAERERAEEARLFATVLNNARPLLASLDRELRFVQVNEGYAQFAGTRPEELVGRRWDEVWTDPARIEALTRVRDTGEAQEAHEQRIENPRRPGDVRYTDWSIVPIKGEQGQVHLMVISATDVTERVEAKERLLAGERERARFAETLNAEIDHRMKNNLALIASVLQMQLLSAAEGASASDHLRRAIARIRSLAAVHEQLYEGRSGRVELAGMLRHVGSVATQVLSRGDVELLVAGDAVSVASKHGSTLAILANELITNAVKYGGPDTDGKRRVRITVSRDDGKVGIAVWNSGNPIPNDFDPEAQSGLGLQLAREAVVGQWQGAFSIHPYRGGTTVEIVVDADALTEGGRDQRDPSSLGTEV